jgi:trans-2-enoyl-CoA reductase
MKSRAAWIEQFGPPAEVLQIRESELPAPGPGEVRLKMGYAPVNPADLNLIEGVYGIKPELPSAVGVEGVGSVEAVGPDVSHLSEGDCVIPIKAVPTWQSSLIAPADRCYPIPGSIDLQQASMLSVNPATAWCMLHHFRQLEPEEWVIQNAANSGVGRSVIAIARELGLRTLNLVRRESLIAELQECGADEVLIDSPEAAPQIKALCQGKPPRLALNAVGGESATLLARSLAGGGAHVTYGAMSRKPVTVSNGHLIFKDIEFRGFWVSRWYEEAKHEDIMKMVSTLSSLADQGQIHSPVEKVLPLAAVKEAVTEASRDQRDGKILIDLQN